MKLERDSLENASPNELPGESSKESQRQSPNAASGKKQNERKRIDDSIWEIYLQILGLSGNYTEKIYDKRSLKFMLKDNALLHPLAEDSFPNRDGLTKILNGVHVSYESVRKLLILLVFYRFWVNKALAKGHYTAGYGDADRCLSLINDCLTEAGYPMLYPGTVYWKQIPMPFMIPE